jgi:hypothetical protein
MATLTALAPATNTGSGKIKSKNQLRRLKAKQKKATSDTPVRQELVL